MITIVVIVVLLVTNLTAFFLMGYDKQCAKKNRRRVPEKTLFLTAGLFGGLGGTLGCMLSGIKQNTGISRCSFRC